MTYPRVPILLLATLIAAITIAGCGGAYSAAIDRGDRYAKAKQWDQAEAEYRRAIEIDPKEPEARIKLEKVQRARAGEQVAKAKALEARGEYAKALAALQKAAKATPDDATVQTELTRVSRLVLDTAESKLTGGDPGAAFKLTQLVLRGAPSHPRARSLDQQARGELASLAFDRATEYQNRDMLGNALVELALTLSFQPNYPEAKLEFGRIKKALEEELTFSVVIAGFDARGNNSYIARALTPAILQQSIDDRLLVRVVGPRTANTASAGVSLSGGFTGYEFSYRKGSEGRSCDYVCGTDTKPNPRRAEVERQLGSAEQSMSRVEQNMSRKEQDVAKYEREVMEKQRKVDDAQVDYDKARQKYDDCMQRADPEKSNPCWSEKSRMESEQRDLDSRRRDKKWPMDNLASARRTLDSARRDRDRERDNVARYRSQLRDTPRTIEVERHCPFNYRVSVHDVDARVVMNLTMERASDKSAVVKNQPFNYRIGHRDISHPAYPRRCSSVASGDPVNIPSEKQMRNQLVAKVIADVRAKVMANYDSYRQRHLAVARKSESAGMNDQAVEGYVRYVLTGPHDAKGSKAAAKFLRRARGMSKLDSLWKL